MIERFSAHKCVLAGKSTFFANLFKNSSESKEEIHITGGLVKYSYCFKKFLQLLYALNWEVDCLLDVWIVDVCEMVRFAAEYEVLDIIERYRYCLDEHLNDYDVMFYFDVGHKVPMDEVKATCIEFLKENGEESIASEDFLDIAQPTLKAVLQLDIWKHGKQMVDACMKWAKKQCDKNQLDPANLKDLRKTFGDAFELIPFSAMDRTEFEDFQRVYDAMFIDNEIRKVDDAIEQRKGRS